MVRIRQKPKEEFKPSGKIWGYAFGDYAYKLHADSAQRGNVQYSRLLKDYNSFNFRRIYLGYDYQFTANISSQLLLAHESTFEANPNSTDALTDNNSAVYIRSYRVFHHYQSTMWHLKLVYWPADKQNLSSEQKGIRIVANQHMAGPAIYYIPFYRININGPVCEGCKVIILAFVWMNLCCPNHWMRPHP